MMPSYWSISNRRKNKNGTITVKKHLSSSKQILSYWSKILFNKQIAAIRRLAAFIWNWLLQLLWTCIEPIIFNWSITLQRNSLATLIWPFILYHKFRMPWDSWYEISYSFGKRWYSVERNRHIGSTKSWSSRQTVWLIRY